MSSSSIELLKEKIKSVQRRRTFIFFLRQTSLALASIAVLFLVLVSLEMFIQFTHAGHITLLCIFLVSVFAFILWLIRVIRKLRVDEQHLAHYVEEHIPDLEQRLMTSMEFDAREKRGWSSQLMERLWEDTSLHIRDRHIQRVTTSTKAWPAVSCALLTVCLLLFAYGSWTGFSSASRRIIWPSAGAEKAAALPVKLIVEPGDVRMQRGDDVMISATIENDIPEQVNLFIQTDRVNWDQVPMSKEGSKDSYMYYISSVKEDFTYYVDIELDRSRQYRISVFDLPRIEQADVEYIYPEYTGIENKTDENTGDVVAPEGTQIVLHVTFNKPIYNGTLNFDTGTKIDMEIRGSEASGSFTVTEDSAYTIKVTDNEQLENPDPVKYFVRSIPDSKPQLTLTQPGGDQRAMPLEEVSIAATARDDYGLTKFILNYATAGGEEKEIPLQNDVKDQQDVQIDGRTTIYLEEANVRPGDFITYYLTAIDNNDIQGPSETVSDIYFLDVVSTEEAFRRASQQSKGGGSKSGNQQQPSALVENQKLIIAATWKLLHRQKGLNQEDFKKDVKVVAESQDEVMQRTIMSLQRLSERLSFSDESYKNAVKNLQEAVDHMVTAIEKLSLEQLKEALGPEQSALQAIMKAESQSQITQIRMTRNSGGKGSGGGSKSQREREDLMELFEMEMGRLENRYEMPTQGEDAQDQAEQEDALAELQELARRQERLNRGQKELARKQDQLNEEEETRLLEELRREQEELSRQAAELSNRMSQLSQNKDNLQQRFDRQQQLDQAVKQMQEAAESFIQGEQGNALAKGEEALKNLKEQEQSINSQRDPSASELAMELNRKGQNLQEQEKQILRKLEEINQEHDIAGSQDESGLSADVQELLDEKTQLQKDLREVEDMLQATGTRARQEQSEIEARAIEAMRSLRSERIGDKIDKSQEMLRQGWLSLSMEMEDLIDQSIDRISNRLMELSGDAQGSREEEIQQAAADASGLRRELENLQQDIQALEQDIENQRQSDSSSGSPEDQQRAKAGKGGKQGKSGSSPESPQDQQRAKAGKAGKGGKQGKSGSSSESPQDQQRAKAGKAGKSGSSSGSPQDQQRANAGENRNNRMDGMRERLQRSREYANRILQPWADPERWSMNARSIHRELTQREIEDFLNQPDMWKKLLESVKELESKIRAQAEISESKNRLFSQMVEEVPIAYKDLVEEYFRTLSEGTE